MEYLGNMRVTVLATDAIFLKNEFNEKAVAQFAKIFTTQVDNTKPTWYDMRLLMNKLEDESSYLQYG